MAGNVQAHEVLLLNVMRSVTLTGFAAYAGLMTAGATDTTAGTEVSGSSYARQLVGFTAPASSPSSTNNAADINFPVVTTTGYTVVQITVYDASTAGLLKGYVPTFTGVPIAVGGQARIALGTLIATMD